MHPRSRQRVSFLFASLLIIGACSGSATPTEPSDETATAPDPLSQEWIAAAAIDQFATEFPGNVVDASTVVVPNGLDIEAVQALLDTQWAVTTAPVEADTYWRIMGLSDKGDYWQIDMSSVNGADFFSGSLFFLKTVDGAVERVEPEDVGATATTSVS